MRYPPHCNSDSVEGILLVSSSVFSVVKVLMNNTFVE